MARAPILDEGRQVDRKHAFHPFSITVSVQLLKKYTYRKIGFWQGRTAVQSAPAAIRALPWSFSTYREAIPVHANRAENVFVPLYQSRNILIFKKKLTIL